MKTVSISIMIEYIVFSIKAAYESKSISRDIDCRAPDFRLRFNALRFKNVQYDKPPEIGEH